MPERIEWTRGQECGSGATCPKAGRRESTGTVMVVGRVVTDPSLIEQSGVGPGETLVEVPRALLPEV